MTGMIEPPRLEHLGPLALAGLLRHHSVDLDIEEASRRITAQWGAFLKNRGALAAGGSKTAYGIALSMADGALTFDYFCGTVLTAWSDLPAGFTILEVPALRCAVFPHPDSASRIRETLHLAFGTILPRAKLEPVGSPAALCDFLERYGENFDHKTGLGGLEILVPVKA